MEVLDSDTCVALLRETRIGRIGFVADGQLHIVPVNFAADEEGRVVLRTTTTGLLHDAPSQPVAFEVDGFDEHTRTGWSVCVHGVGREISTADDAGAVLGRQLPVEPWAPGERPVWLMVLPLAITGRRLSIAPGDAEDWFGGVPLS